MLAFSTATAISAMLAALRRSFPSCVLLFSALINDVQILLVDLMYTAASGAINVLGIPIGMFIDGRGPRAAALAGLLLLCAALCCSCHHAIRSYSNALQVAQYQLLVDY